MHHKNDAYNNGSAKWESEPGVASGSPNPLYEERLPPPPCNEKAELKQLFRDYLDILDEDDLGVSRGELVKMAWASA